MVLRIRVNKILKRSKPDMTYKALFLDIDGTILMPDHTYTDLTKEAITKAKQQGIEVFLATGRATHEIEDLALDLGVDSLNGYNGAYAIYQGEVVVNEPKEPQMVNEFVKLSQEHGNEIALFTNGNNLSCSLNHPNIKYFINIFQLQQSEHLDKTNKQDNLCMTLRNMDSENPQHCQTNPNTH